jgi:hypothetical protein
VLGFAASCSSTPHDSTNGSIDGGSGHTVAEAGDAASGAGATPSDGGSPGSEPLTAGAGGGGTNTQPGGGDVGDACGAIVVCVQECPDDACFEACFDRGSSTAQQLFDELLDCLDLYGCDDPNCLQLNCAAEADACTSDRQTGSTSNGGAPGSGEGTLPADLIGEWATSDGSTTYRFEADGSYEYGFHYNSSLACIAFLSQKITEVGNVSVHDDILTTVGTSRTTKTQDCNFSSSTDQDGGETKSYRYTLAAGTLTLIEAGGIGLTLTQ